MKTTAGDSGNVRDALVAVLCVSVIAATAYSLYLDGAMRLEAGDAAPAGEIDFRTGEAHRRYADRALWEDLDPGDLVYNRNSIRTGDGESAASIRLNDDTRIELDQATMIVLQIDENEIRLQLKAGSLEIRRSRPRYDRPITVGRGDHVLELDSGEVRLESTDDPGMHVTPMLGSVVVRESSRRVRTGDRMTLSTAGRALQQLGILLLPPTRVTAASANETRAPEAAKAEPESSLIRLTWQYRGDAESPETQWPDDADTRLPAVVEVGSDPGFARALRRVTRPALPDNGDAAKARSDHLEVRLAPGQYYWRVRQGSRRSATAKFRVAAADNQAALQIITPAPGSEVRAEPRRSRTRAADVQFAWAAPANADYYRLQIFRKDQSGEAPLVDRRVERDYVRVRLAPGEYQFRVRSVSAGEDLKSPLTPFRLVAALDADRLRTNDAADSAPGDAIFEAPALSTATLPGTNSPENARQTQPDAANGETESRPAPDRPARESARIALLYPAEGQTVDMAQRDGILFRWRPIRADRAHRIRFFEINGGSQRLLFERTTREGRAQFAGLQELEHDGHYRWTVEALSTGAAAAKTNDPGSSAAASFRIILSTQPEQPQFLPEGGGSGTDAPAHSMEAGP